MLILFKENKSYENVVFEKGCVYDLSEDDGFAHRWLKRGCFNVSKEDAKKILKDPRLNKNKKVVKPKKRTNNNPTKK